MTSSRLLLKGIRSFTAGLSRSDTDRDELYQMRLKFILWQTATQVLSYITLKILPYAKPLAKDSTSILFTLWSSSQRRSQSSWQLYNVKRTQASSNLVENFLFVFSSPLVLRNSLLPFCAVGKHQNFNGCSHKY